MIQPTWQSEDGAGPSILKAPFPYFGGKSRVANIVWTRLGEVRNYVEPFFGSGATLLRRPNSFVGTETVNDKDGFVANFWRAVQAAPDEVAFHADWPVNENDLHARHIWLVGEKDSMQTRLEGDSEFFDAKIAGWWCWGMCCWIGGGFCSGNGPWQSVEVDGVRQLVHLGTAGMGINRQRVELGTAGRGVNRQSEGIYEWMSALSARLKRVRVCSGDWSRVCGPAVTQGRGLTAVFLDPPYADTAERTPDLYRIDSLDVAHAVREWAIANGSDKKMRIALCGYEGEHVMPADWECFSWKASGGYSIGKKSASSDNSRKERIWFSPHCIAANSDRQLDLFLGDA